MKTKCIKQISKEELNKINFDIVIASSGYEERASYIPSLIKSNSREKIVFSFDDYKEHKIRKKNDETFTELGYNFFDSNGDNASSIIEILDNIITKTDSDINILVDYSSMTRVWYGAIINYFKYLNIDNKTIHLYFAYSCAELHKPINKEYRMSHFFPVDDYCSLSTPFVPSVLITGLGYETSQTYGLKEFFDAELLYLFHTSNNEFTEHVLNNNFDLIKQTPSKCIIPYNINDILLMKTILYDLCIVLKNNFRIIIAPCGPKPFTLISFFVASELESIDVWRISTEDIDVHANRVPTGEIISCEICYVS